MLLEAIEDAGFEGEVVQQADSNTVMLQVEGMTCSSCSSAVETALASQKGVVSAAVNLLAKRAEVLHSFLPFSELLPMVTACSCSAKELRRFSAMQDSDFLSEKLSVHCS